MNRMESSNMDLIDLRKENELVDLFCSMAEVPSPSLKEDKIIDWVCNYCKENNLDCELDDFKNIYITIRLLMVYFLIYTRCYIVNTFYLINF